MNTGADKEKIIPPFKMAANLYFVGTYEASSHLIATKEGLILIDAGYPQTADVIANGIKTLGFDIENLKYIILSHEHIDHTGGVRRLLKLEPNAKTCIGRRAANFASYKGFLKECVFTPDIILNDGDVVQLDDIRIFCMETPGHTPGTMSFFFDVEENGKKLRVGTFGGASVNQIRKDRLDKYNLPYRLRGEYHESVQRLKKEHVDVFMANHSWQNNTKERYEKSLVSSENQFIDSALWSKFLNDCEKNLEDMMLEESRSMFVNYAHRGASEYAPENTFMSFYLGLFMQANGIETDVQITKDKTLVLFHDDSLNRTVNENGQISDYTYDELQVFDVIKGNLKDKIVKFEDFLKMFGHRDITFTIELKVDGIEEAVIDLLKKYDMQNKTIITSFSFDMVRAAKKYAPEFRIGYLTKEISEDVERQLVEIGADQICPKAEQITRERVDRWHKLGFNVRAWGVCSEKIMKNVYDCMADGMTVNFPDKLNSYIRSKGKK